MLNGEEELHHRPVRAATTDPILPDQVAQGVWTVRAHRRDLTTSGQHHQEAKGLQDLKSSQQVPFINVHKRDGKWLRQMVDECRRKLIYMMGKSHIAAPDM